MILCASGLRAAFFCARDLAVFDGECGIMTESAKGFVRRNTAVLVIIYGARGL